MNTFVNIRDAGILSVNSYTGTVVLETSDVAITASAFNKALVSSGTGFVAESTVTATELGYVAGVTSSIQAQIDAISGGSVLVFTSTASVGGAAAEALTVTGLLATDTIIAVSQKTQGAANLPLLAFSALINNGLTGHWVADPASGAVIIVAVTR